MPGKGCLSVPESDNRRPPDEFADRRATMEDHLRASDSLRQSAERALDAGDLVLASEAYWGIVAHALQAVAEQNGIRHSTNLDFKRIISWLISETQNGQIRIWFERSYRLHQNFYRIVMTHGDIRDYSQYALRLADEIRVYA